MNLQIMSLYGADELLKIKTEKVSLIDCSKMDYLYKQGYYYGKNRAKMNF